MIENIRRSFNASFTPERYQGYLQTLEGDVGMHVEFRISETPVFLSKEMERRLTTAAREILAQVIDPAYLRKSDAAIPAGQRAPNESDHPEFVQIDFGLMREADGSVGLRLIELQGFPSIYAFQELMGRRAIEQYRIAGFHHLIGGMNEEEYYGKLSRTIVRDHEKTNVVLLEIDPLHQKTRPDFVWTEKRIGVRTVDIRSVEKEGRDLFYRNDEGRRVHIDRIYNRAIIDELQSRRIDAPFSFTDELTCSWACHPNWYYRISKYSLPFLAHPCVPKTTFLDELPAIPSDLENYVLKPLFSFAGSGVVVGPTREQIDAVPDRHRHDYVLQEKVEYAPLLETPSGGTKVELRVMFIWDTEPVPVNFVVRTGRGKMMGVDFNKNLDWVGATSALIAG